MDKLLATLLNTSWGRSFIGWTTIASFVSMVSVGWAYWDLLKDYQTCEKRFQDHVIQTAVKEEARWRERIAELRDMHARHDSIMNSITNPITKSRRKK